MKRKPIDKSDFGATFRPKCRKLCFPIKTKCCWIDPIEILRIMLRTTTVLEQGLLFLLIMGRFVV